jgi:hypothetical protein
MAVYVDHTDKEYASVAGNVSNLLLLVGCEVLFQSGLSFFKRLRDPTNRESDDAAIAAQKMGRFFVGQQANFRMDFPKHFDGNMPPESFVDSHVQLKE